LEAEEKKLTADGESLEARLAASGISPIGQQRQIEIQELLRHFAGDQPLHAMLASLVDRAVLKARVREAQTLPDVPTPIVGESLKDLAQKVAERALSLDLEAERLWPLPEQWGKILKTLREECDKIVSKHLPETLQRVLREIAGALTAARWNVAGKPVLQNRGQGKAIVSFESRQNVPARYLMNQAEQHNMGLAWFVVRYLTHGRFRAALIALDDPAQEMDQTTFRSFGRFIQAFQRIHEIRKKSVQIVLFLHQEDRALDITRATFGRFLMLPWLGGHSDATQQNLTETRLYADGFFPVNPIALLAKRAPTN
jgi:hypothetical protein